MAQDDTFNLNLLPSDAQTTIKAMPADIRHQFEEFIAEKRLHCRLERRHDMEDRASFAANLACKIYFQGLKARNTKVNGERLSRKHKDDAEQAVHKLHQHREHDIMSTFRSAKHAIEHYTHTVHRRPKTEPVATRQGSHDHGLMSGIHNIQRNAQDALRLYSPNLHRAPCSDALRVDVAVPRPATPVHVSVASTLEMIGVANRIDATEYDGLRYMDVVAELLPGERKSTGVRGLVVQILPESARSSYVGIKTAALHEDGWAVITVKQDHWERKDAGLREKWLRRKLAGCGIS